MILTHFGSFVPKRTVVGILKKRNCPDSTSHSSGYEGNRQTTGYEDERLQGDFCKTILVVLTEHVVLGEEIALPLKSNRRAGNRNFQIFSLCLFSPDMSPALEKQVNFASLKYVHVECRSKV
jgi:hypothetical protein